MTLKVDGTNGILQAYDYQVLTTGFSYTFAAGTTTLLANPAGTLATGTITMPAAPVDGMVITFSTTKQITALTVNGNTGQSVTSGPTFMAAGSSASYVYNLANTAWRPLNNVPQLLDVPLGVGQTWTDVKTSPGRAYGTTYTNTTGKPILIFVMGTGSSSSSYATVAGVTAGGANTTSTACNVWAIVPSGATYVVSMTGASLQFWTELR